MAAKSKCEKNRTKKCGIRARSPKLDSRTMATPEEIERMRRELESIGYKVRKPSSAYVKKSFEVERDILKRFMDEIEQRGLKMKDAINQALTLWLDSKHQNHLDSKDPPGDSDSKQPRGRNNKKQD